MSAPSFSIAPRLLSCIVACLHPHVPLPQPETLNLLLFLLHAVLADDVMNNNCKYDFSCVAPCALRWVKACLDKRRRRQESQLMRAIHVLHHRPLDVHLLQAITFE